MIKQETVTLFSLVRCEDFLRLANNDKVIADHAFNKVYPNVGLQIKRDPWIQPAAGIIASEDSTCIH